MRIALIVIALAMLLIIGAEARYSPGLEIASGENINLSGGYISTSDEINVGAYGAVGDGITNDTTAILAALGDVPDGGKLIFPVGSFKYVGNLNVTGTGVTIQGAGKRGTYLKNYGDSTGINLTGSYCEIRDLNLYGDDGTTGDGIRVLGSNCVIRDVIVQHQGGHGVYVGTDATGTTNTNVWRIYNLYSMLNGGDGAYINNPSGVNVNGGVAVGMQLDNNDGDGLHLGASMLNHYSGVVSQNNGKIGINLSDDAAYNTIINPDAESNTGDEIKIQSGASSNYLLLNPSQGTSFTDVDKTNIIDIFSSSTRYTNGLRWGHPAAGFTIYNNPTFTLSNTSTAIDNWDAITISDSPQSGSVVRGSTSIKWKGAGGGEVGNISVFHNRGIGAISYMAFLVDGTEIFHIHKDPTPALDLTGQLTITSTKKPFVPPRMNTTQIAAISSPTVGGLVYNTSTKNWVGYTGSSWVDV